MSPLAAPLVDQEHDREPTPDGLPPVAPPAAATTTPARPPATAAHARRRVDRRTALWLGIGLPAVTAVNIAIEPVPANPDAPVPVLASLLFLAFTVAVVATCALAARRDAGLFPYAVAAGVGAVVLTVTCPMSGHHAGVGWWWYTQMALSGGFLAASAATWRRHHAGAG